MDNIETTKNKAEEKKPHKLFDYCMSNPPYQEETQKTDLKKGCQKTVKNVFPVMQEATDNLTRKGSVMVYPAGRWIQQSGKGMKNFGLEQINDPHLSTVVVYPDSRDVFPRADIVDGISIVSKKMDKESQEFNYNYKKDGKTTSVVIPSPGENLIPIDPKDTIIFNKIDKFVDDNKLQFLKERAFSQRLFGIESDFVEQNPDAVYTLHHDSPFNPETQAKILTNDKAGVAGKTKWFIIDRNRIPLNREYIDKWQVVVSSAHPAGHKRNNYLEIIDNHSAFGRARIALGSFGTEQEAIAFYKYMKSYIARYALLLADDRISTLGRFVPDLIDYTSSNSFIDFSCEIDTQLCRLIGLTDEEFEYIKKTVTEEGCKN